MNKKEKEKLMKLFKEQQKLNLELFEKEINQEFFKVNYKIEKAELELAILNTKSYLKDIYDLEKSLKVNSK